MHLPSFTPSIQSTSVRQWNDAGLIMLHIPGMQTHSLTRDLSGTCQPKASVEPSLCVSSSAALCLTYPPSTPALASPPVVSPPSTVLETAGAAPGSGGCRCGSEAKDGVAFLLLSGVSATSTPQSAFTGSALPGAVYLTVPARGSEHLPQSLQMWPH